MAESKQKKLSQKTEFIVEREFAGQQTMREVFEQLIEKQSLEKIGQEWSEQNRKIG